jgi:hypothetical protein
MNERRKSGYDYCYVDEKRNVRHFYSEESRDAELQSYIENDLVTYKNSHEITKVNENIYLIVDNTLGVHNVHDAVRVIYKYKINPNTTESDKRYVFG